MSPVWFITGCSTGLGRALAQAVIDRGWRIVVTARQPSQIQDLIDGHEENAVAAKLDVTISEDIVAAVKIAEERFGRVDVLVNNAGYGYRSTIEEGEDDEIRRQFETNVFGLIETIRAVLPGMRTRHSGHVVNVSSIGGLIGFPGTGYYSATKFAVEGLSEALAVECKPFGVNVTIVEPGPFRTDFSDRSIVESAAVIGDYAPTAGRQREQLRQGAGKQPGDPARAAEAIIAAVTAADPPLRLLLGARALRTAYGKLDTVRANFDTWTATTLGADFPEFQQGR
ncbi:oxidoreductase [Caballeronia sp. dw_19]|uniref:oxidoreductase n=1 Tax=Caballeronia sp. dw_19 TaxID=2719791 RepID=UPI003211CA7D